jgi:hypothetical protein
VRMLNSFGTLLSPRFFRLKPEAKRTK